MMVMVVVMMMVVEVWPGGDHVGLGIHRRRIDRRWIGWRRVEVRRVVAAVTRQVMVVMMMVMVMMELHVVKRRGPVRHIRVEPA